jgi:hypothetical protein
LEGLPLGRVSGHFNGVAFQGDYLALSDFALPASFDLAVHLDEALGDYDLGRAASGAQAGRLEQFAQLDVFALDFEFGLHADLLSKIATQRT